MAGVSHRTGSPTDKSDPVDRSPGRTSVAFAVASAAAVPLLLPTAVGTVVGAVGALFVAAGAMRGSRRTVGYGTITGLAAVAGAGYLGGSAVSLVAATLAAMVAWDAARYGIAIGEQLGRGAATAGIETAHTTLTATVGVLGAGIGYLSYLLVDGGEAPVALLVLLVGLVLLLSAFQ